MPASRKVPAASQGAGPTPAVVRPEVKRAKPSRPGIQQSLFLPAVVKAPQNPRPVAKKAGKRLWLCIHLPRLPLEALYRRDEKAARAVFEEQQGMRRILQANASARAAGVGTGQPVNAALSLLPELGLEERSPVREKRLMKRLAVWANRFTPVVAIEPGNVLLLEIAGSERFFDGIEPIRQKILQGLDVQAVTATLAIAPTPLASIWLAKSGRAICIDDVSRLAARLGKVPLGCLEWPTAVQESLYGMGVNCVADCLRLPRQGFARRFGTRFLLELDRALGRLPDPRKSHRASETFCADAELDEEQGDSELLLPVCRALLEKLERFLRTRQIRIQRVRFSFFHLREAATQLTLGRVQAGQDVDHWFDLLRIKLERIALPEPVIAIRLRGGQGQLSPPDTGRLPFAGSKDPGNASIVCLVERLSARLGDAAVHGVAAVAEHRPHHAWRASPLFDEAPRCAMTTIRYWNQAEMPELLQDIRRTSGLLLRRPLWVLDSPERLATRDGMPMYRGVLSFVDGPERLESGWWDGDGIARDYFIARTETGVHLWTYRDRQSRHAAWYLHGIFA